MENVIDCLNVELWSISYFLTSVQLQIRSTTSRSQMLYLLGHYMKSVSIWLLKMEENQTAFWLLLQLLRTHFDFNQEAMCSLSKNRRSAGTEVATTTAILVATFKPFLNTNIFILKYYFGLKYNIYSYFQIKIVKVNIDQMKIYMWKNVQYKPPTSKISNIYIMQSKFCNMVLLISNSSPQSADDLLH